MKLILLLIITTCTLVFCEFDVEFINHTMKMKRQLVSEYPIFKVKNCPKKSTGLDTPISAGTAPIIGKYILACKENLAATASLTLKGVCYPNDPSDTELGGPSFTFVINYITDNGALYYGGFFIKDYSYGSLKVIVDKEATVGSKTNLYFNTYTCATPFCGGDKIFTSCTTKNATCDFSGTGDRPIISLSTTSGDPSTVDFCRGTGSECCTRPTVCPYTVYTISALPGGSTGQIDSPASGRTASFSVAQPFFLPTGASVITGVGFYVKTNSGSQIYDLYIYKWLVDGSGSRVTGPPLWSGTGTASSSITLDFVTVSPPLVLVNGVAYAAIMSLNNGDSTAKSIFMSISSDNSVLSSGFFTNADFTQPWGSWFVAGFKATFT